MESSTQDPIIREIPAQMILGAVAFGKPKPTTRDHPLASDEACHDLIEHFYTRGGRELDTARVYQNGNCEAMLGRLGASKKIKIATKYNPNLREALNNNWNNLSLPFKQNQFLFSTYTGPPQKSIWRTHSHLFKLLMNPASSRHLDYPTFQLGK